MDYAAALEYISASGRFGIKLGLTRVRALLDALGAPDAGLRGVLVAGTNGKGSTCAFIGSVLTAAGYRVGSMPKPHLSSYTERICVDGVPISEAAFATAIDELRPVVDAVAEAHGPATEFEMLTAAAVQYLRRAGVDWLVCEVGLGGRLDATNVLDLGVKVVTTIALDHVQYLGPDIPSIATEKAGIIRAGDVVVTGRLPEAAAAVVAGVARRQGVAAAWRLGHEVQVATTASGPRGTVIDVATPRRRLSGIAVPLLGAHQADNAAVAVAAIDAMAERHGATATDAAVLEGVAATAWPGRLELLAGAPEILVDSGHNPAAVATVVATVEAMLQPGRRAVLLFGAMADKDIAGMIARLPRGWPAVLTAVDEPRAASPEELLALARAAGRTTDEAQATVAGALARTRQIAGERGLVLVVGSLYLAGAVRQALAEAAGTR